MTLNEDKLPLNIELNTNKAEECTETKSKITDMSQPIDWTFFTSPAIIVSSIISLVAIFSPWFFMLMALIVIGILLIAVYGLTENKPHLRQKFLINFQNQLSEITKNIYYSTMAITTLCTVLFALFDSALKFLFAFLSVIIISLPSLLPAVASKAMYSIKKYNTKTTSQEKPDQTDVHKNTAEIQAKNTQTEPLSLADTNFSSESKSTPLSEIWEQNNNENKNGINKFAILTILSCIAFATWYSWNNYLDETTKKKAIKFSKTISEQSNQLTNQIINKINITEHKKTNLKKKPPSKAELIKLLRLAIRQNNITKIKNLMMQDIDINFVNNKTDISILHYAAMLNNAPVVSLLISQGANANLKCNGQLASDVTTDKLIKHILITAQNKQRND